MFKWFRRNKIESEPEDEVEKPMQVKNTDNYTITKDGNIEVKTKILCEISFYGNGYCIGKKTIPKSSIISCTKNNIVFKDYRYYYNFESKYYYFGTDLNNCSKSIENKENFIRYKETQIKTYKYCNEGEYWGESKVDIVGTEVISERTPLEIFKEEFNSKYGLIETEEEFNEYLSSTLDCNTWCRMKLYNKMRELGLGDGFINSFADLVGNDLEKYHAMIDLANEVTDKDTLMYLYTYKFKQDN